MSKKYIIIRGMTEVTQKKEASALAINFIKSLELMEIDFANDNIWPRLAEPLLDSLNKDEKFRIDFWDEMAIQFQKKEGAFGAFYHKGQIFWNSAWIRLHWGELDEALSQYKKSRAEDIRRSGSDAIFTAALGMMSMLDPLINRYKTDKKNPKNSDIKADVQISEYYHAMTSEEKRHFAESLAINHNNTVAGLANEIRAEYFGFIQDESKLVVIYQTYQEVKGMLTSSSANHTYYTCVFAIGSILEAMLDDLFERDDSSIWKKFQNNEEIQKTIDDSSRLRKSEYPSDTTLGEKLFALRLLTKYGTIKIPKNMILQMLIISEYRDLIHPRRREKFQYEANRYTAINLFSFIANIASYWWPENLIDD